MRIEYIADDGTSFNNEADCLSRDKQTALIRHIEEFCPKTYCDDHGCHLINERDVEKYIRTYIAKICRTLDIPDTV